MLYSLVCRRFTGSPWATRVISVFSGYQLIKLDDGVVKKVKAGSLDQKNYLPAFLLFCFGF